MTLKLHSSWESTLKKKVFFLSCARFAWHRGEGNKKFTAAASPHIAVTVTRSSSNETIFSIFLEILEKICY